MRLPFSNRPVCVGRAEPAWLGLVTGYGRESIGDRGPDGSCKTEENIETSKILV